MGLKGVRHPKTSTWRVAITQQVDYKNSFSPFKEEEASSSQWQSHFSTLKSSINVYFNIPFSGYEST